MRYFAAAVAAAAIAASVALSMPFSEGFRSARDRAQIVIDCVRSCGWAACARERALADLGPGPADLGLAPGTITATVPPAVTAAGEDASAATGAPAPCGRVCIFVLCHDDASEAAARADFAAHAAWARVHRIPRAQQSHLFEGVMYSEALWALRSLWQAADFVGTVSYKLAAKANFSNFVARLSAADAAREDVVYFLPGHGDPFSGHGNDREFRALFQRLAAAAGLPPLPPADHVWAFCNFWMATPSYMASFLRFFVETWLPLINAEPLVWADAHYRDASLPRAALEQLTGRPHYTQHAFLNERVTSVFFALATRARIGCTPKLLRASVGAEWLDWARTENAMRGVAEAQGATLLFSGGAQLLGHDPTPGFRKQLKVAWLDEHGAVKTSLVRQGEKIDLPRFSDAVLDMT